MHKPHWQTNFAIILAQAIVFSRHLTYSCKEFGPFVKGTWMSSKEWVLAIPRSLLDELGTFQGIQLEVESYLTHILDPLHTRFLPRVQAEEDPTFKQIIPYVLIRREEALLHYVRGKSSGEQRLVAKGSIGIGGHINPTDESLFNIGRDFYDDAVQRELHEELKMDGTFRTRIAALLNDDSTPVGQVHLGIVHVCDLSEEDVSKGEACITELKFLTLAELRSRREELETWSQLCLDQLPQLVQAAKL
jgi:predicted NUDIX family phosphoesterase